MDYLSLWEYSEAIAQKVDGRCLVFLLCTESVATIGGYLGFLNHGIVPVMLDGHLESKSLAKLCGIYRPSYLWLPEKRAKEFSEWEKILSLDGYELLKTTDNFRCTLHEELALLMTTSGSTGSPKLVRLSYDNILSNMKSIVEYLGIDENERAITSLPLHYVYGLSIIHTHLYVGASLVVTGRTMFDKGFWQLIHEKAVTSLSGVPYTMQMLERLHFFRMEVPSLRTITQAGGKLAPELHKKFAEYAEKNGKKFIVMYGAAEATARMGYLPPADSCRKCGSMGIAIPGGRFELVDETGKVVSADGLEGELVYYGRNVMLGYAECEGDLAKGDEYHGRLPTGDVATRDVEGYYTIVGRRKHFLKMFGKRTNLQEVEDILRQQFPQTEVACAGQDDHMYVFMTDESKIEAVIPYLSQKIGIHPSAFRVIYMPALPRNAAGKIIYSHLEQYYDI